MEFEEDSARGMRWSLKRLALGDEMESEEVKVALRDEISLKRLALGDEMVVLRGESSDHAHTHTTQKDQSLYNI